MASNPFDRRHLGYEALFGDKTRFVHVPPREGEGELIEWIDVPVLHLGAKTARWIESGTVGTVVLAFLGLCWVLFRGLKGGEATGGKEKGGERKKESKGKKKQ